MCIFISLKASGKQVAKTFNTAIDTSLDLNPRYAVSAYTYPLFPTITATNSSQITYLQWGLVPRWVKDATQADAIRTNTLNARSETLSEKPSFKHTTGVQRCIVPVDGFFEFREVNKKKFPYHIRLQTTELFAIAGLWDIWEHTQSGELRNTFTLITTEANSLMSEIHNRKKRMPVIIPINKVEQWLDTSLPFSQVKHLLNPYPTELMEAFSVSSLLSSRSQPINTPQVSEPFFYNELNMLF